MTKEEWLTVEVGDFLIERKNGARRMVLDLSRVSGSRGQKHGSVRTAVRVQSIKSPERTIVVCSTEDVGRVRWSLEKAPQKTRTE